MIYCNRCGSQNLETARFCGRCGADLAPAPATPSPAVVPAPWTTPAPPSYTPSPHPVSGPVSGGFGGGPVEGTEFDSGVQFMGGMLQPGTTFARRFEIRKLLGQGGMGSVYLAHDKIRRREVALKLMLPNLIESERARERFIREVTTSQNLRHEHIVQVLDLGSEGPEDKPFLYYTMEFIGGEDVRKMLESSARSGGHGLPLQAILRIMEDVCAALDYAHNHKPRVVHRDLSPDNILVRHSDGECVLMDFGIAKAMEEENRSAFTKTGQAIGKAHYMAPEQSRDGAHVDHRADIYSMGIILYELSTGHLPQGARPEPIAAYRNDLPAGFQDIFEKAAAPRAENRYNQAMDLWRDVQAAVEGRPLTAATSHGASPAPLTPAPVTPALVTPAPVTAPPVNKAVSPAPVTPSPASLSPAPVEAPKKGKGKTVAMIVGGFVAVGVALVAITGKKEEKTDYPPGESPMVGLTDPKPAGPPGADPAKAEDPGPAAAPSTASKTPGPAGSGAAAAIKLSPVAADAPLDTAGDAPAQGPENARVVITVFSDFQCPFCAKLPPVIKQIRQTWPDDVRVVWRNLPLDFHPRAKPASIAATAAGAQGKFWEFHDQLFANPKALEDNDFLNTAAQLGLDKDRFQAALKDAAVSKYVEADITYSKAWKVTGTPSSFVNGKLLAGAQPFDTFKEAIETELAAMQQLISSGKDVKQARLERIKINQSAPGDEKKHEPILEKPREIAKTPPKPVKAAKGERFTDNGDGTISDSKTGLMWTKDDSYNRVKKCMTYGEAVRFVRGLSTGGHRDWRVPTVSELFTLYKSGDNRDFDNEGLAYSSAFSRGGTYMYWSSETVGGSSAKAVALGKVYGGKIDTHAYSDCGASLGVRAVRRNTK
ncbi:MAG: Serine/threonine-protein kinase PknD [Myxococcota bacterium]|nr:Serine/threonine-protein kinase PknD [Myxococcota bacterium]